MTASEASIREGKYLPDGLTGNVFEDMAAFDRKYGFDKVEMTPQFLGFRLRFLVEELREGIDALMENRPADFVDSMIDLIVVAAGTLSIGGVDGQKAWNEVRRANMSKERRENPTRPGSGGADLIKPDGWTPPNHEGNLGRFKSINSWDLEEHFPYSISVLFEAMKEQFLKYEDYNSGLSGLKRGEYWIHGINSLEYEMNKKMIRFRSVLAKLKAGEKPNFESEEDSLVNNINYHSFAVALLRGREPGYNNALRDLFGNPTNFDISIEDRMAERIGIESDLREEVGRTCCTYHSTGGKPENGCGTLPADNYI